MIDARISVGLPQHPKTKKLIKRLGDGAAWRLVCLILWSASNKPNGNLEGMTAEDIELAVDWNGTEGAFVAALLDVGFLDGNEGAYVIHDWSEHNPWAAGAEARSEKSRWASLCKQYGRQKAAEMMPWYAPRVPESASGTPDGVPESASGTPDGVPESASGTRLAESRSPPSPSPSPLPNPKKHSEAIASGGKPPTMTADEIIFGYGVPMLTGAGIAEKQARSFLGGLRKEHGDGLVIDKLRDCMRAKPLQPLEWLAAALPPGGGRRAGKQAQVESRNAAVVADWRPPEIREAA